MIYEILIVASLLAIIAVLAIAIILLLANLGVYFMKIAQGTTAFISTGDSLKAILPNVGGFKMSKDEDLDGRHWLVPEKNDEERIVGLFHNSLPKTVWFQKWMWKTLGVRFISWVWPHTHRHTFNIRSRKRLLEGSEVKSDMSLKDRVVDSPAPEGTIVDSLLFSVPRPVYMDGVQLAGDNSRINLLLQPIYRQVIPAIPVYYLKGDFFTLLDAALEAAVVDFFATHRVEGCPLTYSHWLKLPKSGGNSPLELHLRHLNVSKAYRNKLKRNGELVRYIDELTGGELKLIHESVDEVKKIAPSGIIPRFGFAMVSFRIVDWDPHKDTVDLAKALLAKETELHTAEGVRQKAFGERDALIERAKGESSRFDQLMKALIEKGVDANVAAEVVRTQLRTENIGGKDSKITTYVEGEASASVMVSASSSGPSTK